MLMNKGINDMEEIGFVAPNPDRYHSEQKWCR